MDKRLFLLGAAIALGATSTGFFARRSQSVEPTAQAQAAAADIFRLTLLDSEGRSLSFESWRGKLIVLNFWATWCSPCRAEMPAFDRLARRHADAGVQFVGIAIDSREKVARFGQEIGISYPLLIADGPATQLMTRLGNIQQLLPYTVIVEPSGKLREVRTGVYHEAELEAIIGELSAKSS